MRSSFLVHAERRRMLSQRQEQNTDLAAANPSKKSGYLFFAEEMSCLYERAETEKQLQAAVWVQHHAAHLGPKNESGGTPAYQRRFHHGTDRPNERLYHFEPLCGAMQKEHGHPAHRVPKNRKAGIRPSRGTGTGAAAVCLKKIRHE